MTESPDLDMFSIRIQRRCSRRHVSIPEELRNSVVRLKAPNADAVDGETDVFVLGMSHVSQESVKAVRSLIEAVRPEVRPYHAEGYPALLKMYR